VSDETKKQDVPVDAGVLVRAFLRTDAAQAKAAAASKEADTTLRSANEVRSIATRAMAPLVPKVGDKRSFTCDGWTVRVSRDLEGPLGVSASCTKDEKSETL
jgi:hypothetical protein